MGKQKDSRIETADVKKEMTLEAWVLMMWSRMGESINIINERDVQNECERRSINWDNKKHEKYMKIARDRFIITSKNTLAVGGITALRLLEKEPSNKIT